MEWSSIHLVWTVWPLFGNDLRKWTNIYPIMQHIFHRIWPILPVHNENMRAAPIFVPCNIADTVTFELPYILESNTHPNLIRTSFCWFLKRKKLVHDSNPQLLQKSHGGYQLHGKPSRRALSSDLWTDPKMTFYGRTMVKIKMIVTGWRITIQLWVITASLMNNKL